MGASSPAPRLRSYEFIDQSQSAMRQKQSITVIKLRHSFEDYCGLDYMILSRPTLSSKIILGICLTRMEK